MTAITTGITHYFRKYASEDRNVSEFCPETLVKSTHSYAMMRIHLLLIVLLASLLISCSSLKPGDHNPSAIYIGSWNLQRFGDAKAADAELLTRYASVVRQFDVFIVQELTDKDGSSFTTLCETVGENYSCVLSSRAGTTSYKESYGIFVRKNISILSTIDYAALNSTGFERPPFFIALNDSGYVFGVYTLHTKPEATPAELSTLERLVVDSGNVVIIGDLNADCSYYTRGAQFTSWRWAINQDTTAGKSNCAYDRILLNKEASREYQSSGVLPVGGEGISDHNAAWVALHRGEKTGWWS